MEPNRRDGETISVAVGNNTPTTHPILGTIPVKGCFPLPVTKTGTFQTDHSGNPGSNSGKNVKGTSTLFLSELSQGDFLADSNGVLRRIKWIFSDTMLELEARFPVSQSGTLVKVVKKSYYNSIIARSTGTAAATLNEQNFAIGAVSYSEGAPMSYDVSTASSEIRFELNSSI